MCYIWHQYEQTISISLHNHNLHNGVWVALSTITTFITTTAAAIAAATLPTAAAAAAGVLLAMVTSTRHFLDPVCWTS